MPGGPLVDDPVDQPALGGSSESTSPLVYRPHLDGLRAVAVYLVVLFHAGSKSFSGGYIGVDVFFVLSGFLVTQLLLRDVARGGGIAYGRFYSRRFRRLLPAAFVTLIVTAFVYTAIASPVEVSDAVGSFKAAFLYSTNWYFIHQSSNYFGATIATNPLLHFWSLAVEEQFYLVWPLALGGVLALTRRLDHAARLRAVAIAVAIAAIGSMVWALSLRTADPNHAYYGTDARAYELLAGALLALVPTVVDSATRFRRSMRLATTASVVGLLVLASSWINLDAIERGIAVTITTCVLLVAIEAAGGGVVQRALSTRPVVYLGKISYGTYLWHWIVILVATNAFHLSSIATVGIACLVATALASLSFNILEQPVRTSRRLDRYRGIVIATGLTVSVVSALVLIPKIVTPANATAPVVRNSTTALLTPVPRNLVFETAHPTATSCLDEPASACTVIHGTGRHLLLIGDSAAQMMVPLFTTIAQRENLTLSVSVQPGCPWQLDLYTQIRRDQCKQRKQDLYRRVIPALRPDVTVVMNLEYPTFRPDGNEAGPFAIAAATTASLAALEVGGRDVITIDPIPAASRHNTSFDPLACLSKAKWLEECRYNAPTAPLPLEELYRRLAGQDDKVHVLNLNDQVCPLLPICDPVVDGHIVKQDASHLTIAFSESLAPEVDRYLKSVGLIPPTSGGSRPH